MHLYFLSTKVLKLRLFLSYKQLYLISNIRVLELFYKNNLIGTNYILENVLFEFTVLVLCILLISLYYHYNQYLFFTIIYIEDQISHFNSYHIKYNRTRINILSTINLNKKDKSCVRGVS